MTITIRQEVKGDCYTVESLTREAFWGRFSPRCDEHYLAHRLRGLPAFIPELDLVAEADGRIVGNIMYTKAKVVGHDGKAREVISFGPLSVLPEYQGRGVGAALMRHSLLKAREACYRGVVFFGHPDYYPRFGFQSAALFGITAPDGGTFDALMAMELYDGAMKNINGKFYEDEAFACDPSEVEKFDRLFPPKKPAAMQPITPLLEALPTAAAEFRTRGITALAFLNRVSGRELLSWNGFDLDKLETVNRVLTAYGFPKKLAPGCAILENAKRGIKVLL